MILLKKTGINSAIFTLTEMEVYYEGAYYLDITNPQDHKTISGIFLQDISLNVDRYNEFLIELVDDATSLVEWEQIGSPIVTIIYNLIPGLYDYTAKNEDGDVLEIGKLRVETVADATVGTYSYTPDEYIHKK